MDCKTFTFVDVNAHQLTFDTFDKMLAIFLLKFLQCACKGMFCKTLPSAPVSLILCQRISKGFKLDLASSCLTKRHLCKEERLKRCIPILPSATIWAPRSFNLAFCILDSISWLIVSPHHPLTLKHIWSISLHFCILASNFHLMGLHLTWSIFFILQVSLISEIQITAFKAHSIYVCWIRRHS